MDMPILYGLVCLVAALLVVMVLKWWGVKESATIIAVLVLSVVVWAVKSDIVDNISAGGVTIKLRVAGSGPVKTELLSDLSAGLEVVQKEGTYQIESKVAALKPGTPLSLVIDIDRQNYYRADVILTYLQALLIYDPDTAVILLDSRGKLVASAPAARLAAFLNPPAKLEEVIKQTRSTDEDSNEKLLQKIIDTRDEKRWLALPGFSKFAIGNDKTNLEALALMDEKSLKSVVIVDGDLRPVGISQRDAIVAHLVTKLAFPQKK